MFMLVVLYILWGIIPKNIFIKVYKKSHHQGGFFLAWKGKKI